MAGRPRTLSHNTSKNLTKEELEEKQAEEEMLNEFPKLPKTPPSHLNKTAKKEYRRIIKSLQLLPIADLDLGQVIAYCEFYTDFVEASQKVADEGLVIEAANGDTKINPSFNAKEKAHQRMQSIARTIGMTVDSRLKIIAPKQTESGDAYDDFFDN